MGSLTWNGGSGDWSDPAKWTVVSGSDTVPEAGDIATINATGSYIVTISTPEAVQNLTISASGAEVDVAGALALGGTISDQSGVIDVLAGGTVQDGTVNVGSGGGITLEGGTLHDTKVVAPSGNGDVQGGLLDNVTWQGSMATLGPAKVENGLTLVGANGTGPGALDLTNGGFEFLNSETLDNANISYLGIGGSTNPISNDAGVVLTLGPHLTMTSDGVAQATIDGPGAFVNYGTFEAPGLPGSVLINTDFDNEGSVVTSGFSFEIAGNLTNNGRIGPVGILSSVLVDKNMLGDGTIELKELGPLAAGTLVVNGTIEGKTHIIGSLTGTFGLVAKTIEPGVTLSNFNVGSSIDLTGVPFVDGLTSLSYVDGLLTVMQGSSVVDLFSLLGLPNTAVFNLSADTTPAAGTLIKTTNKAACFASGTRIRTERGEVAVEDLRVGDLVPVVRAGGMLPIIWIGHRRLRIDLQPRPVDLYPVRVAAGAFSDFVPTRDLWLSPEHAVFLHGVLVPVRELINGTTIAQVPRAEVTYWHVELPSHDLLLSEGAWTESFLDMGNRSAFENADAVELHPDFSRDAWRARACQEQERGGPVVEAISRVLNARAAALAEAA